MPSPPCPLHYGVSQTARSALVATVALSCVDVLPFNVAISLHLTGSAWLQAAVHPSLDTLLGLDVDPSALRRASAKLASRTPTLRTSLVCANYSQLADVAAAAAAAWEGEPVEYDGILMDLGCSSMQLDEAGRGFRYVAQ